MATAADHSHGASADAHGAHAGAHDAAHGHGAHVDTTGDKGAAFVGLIGGMLVIGALMYGVVAWTNAQYAGHEGGGEKAAAASTH